MSKKDEFKSFVATKPDLITVVSSKKKTWQDLFEVFDLYGTDEKMWDNYLRNLEDVKATASATATSGISELTKLFKNINIDSVQKYIETAQKAIGIVQELTGNKAITPSGTGGPSSPRPINKIFED